MQTNTDPDPTIQREPDSAAVRIHIVLKRTTTVYSYLMLVLTL